MKDIIQRFNWARICVIGDVMLDHYIIGKATRISPEAPVPIVEVEQDIFCLGGAGNCAANINSLGGRVALIGMIGDDIAGQRILELCPDNERLIISKRPTTQKIRVVVDGKQLARIDREDRSEPDAEINGRVLSMLAGLKFSVLVFSDYAKGFLTKTLIRSIMDLVDVPIIVDTKPGREKFYLGASLITPNQEEALSMDIEGFERVLITKGAEGMTLLQRGESPIDIPTQAQEVFDVSGAGDTVVATLALAMGAGASWEESARLANKAAGIVVEKRGTATVSKEELLNESCAFG